MTTAHRARTGRADHGRVARFGAAAPPVPPARGRRGGPALCESCRRAPAITTWTHLAAGAPFALCGGCAPVGEAGAST